MQQFRGALVCKADRLCVSLNSRFESNKEDEEEESGVSDFRIQRIPLEHVIVVNSRAWWYNAS